MRSAILFAALASVAMPANAVVTLTFDDINDFERPANFYAGGASVGAIGATGPDLGITISDAAIVLQAFDDCPQNGCRAIFPKAPSGNRALFNFPALTSLPALSTINLAAGFRDQVSVWHYGEASSLTVYADVGGRSGNGGFNTVLGFEALPQTTGCIVNPATLTVTGCGWTQYNIRFSGEARSIVLAGFSSYFDNVTFGATGVPEPTSWAMLIAGFGLIGAAMRRRQRLVA